MISFFLLIAACRAEIYAQIDFYPDPLDESAFHMTRIRNRRSSTKIASIGNQAKLQLFESGTRFSEAKVSSKFKAFRRKVFN